MQNNFIALCRNGESFQKFYDQLQKRDRMERRRIVNMIIEGATCLINSSRYGHLDFVRYLVEECEAELELTGSVSFDGEVIEGASPLWCAAAAGQLEVVKFLIAKGANVNKTTCTNSTPLRAACFDGHLAIVRLLVESHADIEIANRHGHTCLMISCYKGHYEIVRYLLDVGADHQRQSTKGNTALHDAAESGNLRILKLLLERGAQLRPDIHGVSPLLGAANSGHANIVDYLASHPELVPDAAERVHAMELLGCTLVDKRRDWVSGLRRWRKALRLRDSLRLPKCVAPRPETAFAGAKEFQTAAELDEVAADPEAVRLQALMVRERILGSEHPDTAYYMRYRGAVYADQGQFESCLRLWLYALELQLRHASPFFPASLASFNNFIELFAFMLSSNARPLAAQWTEVLGQVLCRCVLEVAKSFNALGLPFKTAASPAGPAADGASAAPSAESGVGAATAAAAAAAAAAVVASPDERPLQYADRLLECLATLTALLVRAAASSGGGSSNANEAANDKAAGGASAVLPRSVRQALFDVRGVTSPLTGCRLIHFACQASRRSRITERYPATQLPCAATVRLLLSLGSNPDVANRDGDSPLHLAVRARSVDSVAALLEAGAHADAPNSAGKSPLDELLLTPWPPSSAAGDANSDADGSGRLGILGLLRSARFTRLSCLSAVAFVRSGRQLPTDCGGWLRHMLLAHCPPQAAAAAAAGADPAKIDSAAASAASPSVSSHPIELSYEQQPRQQQSSMEASRRQNRGQHQSV